MALTAWKYEPRRLHLALWQILYLLFETRPLQLSRQQPALLIQLAGSRIADCTFLKLCCQDLIIKPCWWATTLPTWNSVKRLFVQPFQTKKPLLAFVLPRNWMKKKTTTTRSRLLLHALAQLRGNWKKQKCVVENSSSKQALKIRENWSIEISLSRYTDMNKRLLFILALSVATTWSQAQAQDEEDPCTLPASPGNCRGRKRRVFFNPDTKRCEIFFYTGCGGNANIFRNLIDCHETCKHHLENPPAEGEQVSATFYLEWNRQFILL